MLFREKQGFKNLPGFSPFLFLVHHCFASKLLCQPGSDSHWKPHTDTATTPVHQSQPLQPSHGSKAMPEDTLKTFSPTVRLLCEQFPVCPGVTAGVAVAAQMSLVVNLHLLDAPGTQPREHQQQERWFWCPVPLVSKNHFYYMDERQHNPQLVSAWCSELQLMQLIKFQSCASLHKLT